THAGNNTVTEAIHFGCPMVALPIFWDQHDNAQRVHECNIGVRLDTYGHQPDQLARAPRRLLEARELRTRIAAISYSCQPPPGTVQAAEAVERVASGELALAATD